MPAAVGICLFGCTTCSASDCVTFAASPTLGSASPDEVSSLRVSSCCIAKPHRCKSSLNLLQRTGGDHRGGRAQLGWRTSMMTCLRWILGYMRLEIWRKIGLSWDWCLCTALHTRSGACYYWIGWPQVARSRPVVTVVAWSVCHEHELCKNSWTSWDAVYDMDLGVPKEPCIIWAPEPATEGAHLGDHAWQAICQDFPAVDILLPHSPLQQGAMPSVLIRCWLGGRKGIRPVKNWVVGCWHGYLSGERCRLAYGPADATATHCFFLQ